MILPSGSKIKVLGIEGGGKREREEGHYSFGNIIDLARNINDALNNHPDWEIIDIKVVSLSDSKYDALIWYRENEKP
jgi:hypothetical protein